jgi:hypothetical protein
LSIFKTKWIIIKIHKIKNWEFLYTIFTREYWKLLCNKKFSKKEKNLDLWYIINFEIITKENQSIHKIKNIKIISQLINKNQNFNYINTYLLLLAIMNDKCPKWLVINELFEIINFINNENNDEIDLILLRLKMISIFWELNESHKNKTISKILKFINSNKINRILKLTGINIELKKELENI